MRNLALLGTVLALAGLAGCSSQQNEQVRQDVKGVRQEFNQAAENARQAAADAALAAKVKTALETRKGMDPRGIKVQANGSTVILKGDVASPEQAKLAEQVTTETEGVTSVQNELTMRVPATSVPGSNAPAESAPSTPSGSGY